MPTKSLQIALLRGINVGGKNKVPMKSLAAAFTEVGCSEVQTYIQSGNVVFKASDALAARVASLIAEACQQRFGFRVAVVTRTATELHEVARRNPFLRAGADVETLHVAFLDNLPEPSKVASLDPNRSPPDQFAVRGCEIYLCLPHGVGRTKLSNQYFDSKLGTISTIRNWRTVLKLVEWTAGGGLSRHSR